MSTTQRGYSTKDHVTPIAEYFFLEQRRFAALPERRLLIRARLGRQAPMSPEPHRTNQAGPRVGSQSAMRRIVSLARGHGAPGVPDRSSAGVCLLRESAEVYIMITGRAHGFTQPSGLFMS
jgi:hypothetical protein